MRISIIPAKKLPSQQDIKLFEKRIGCNLPFDYKNFIRKYGNGEPELNHFIDNNDISVRSFLSIIDNDKYSVVETLIRINAMDESRIPANYIPIADDGSGNLIMLDIKVGSIWFWDHELEVDNPETSANGPYLKISDNFSQFVESLVPMQKDDFAKLRIISSEIDPEFAKKMGVKTRST